MNFFYYKNIYCQFNLNKTFIFYLQSSSLLCKVDLF